MVGLVVKGRRTCFSIIYFLSHASNKTTAPHRLLRFTLSTRPNRPLPFSPPPDSFPSFHAYFWRRPRTTAVGSASPATCASNASRRRLPGQCASIPSKPTTLWINAPYRVRAISSAGVLKSSAGVKRAYAEHNGLTPPIRKMYMLSIPFSPPMNFSST